MINEKAPSKTGNRIWNVTTPPVIEPITVDEVKIFGRIDGTEEDTMIEGFIEAVREASENYLGRALISQTITLKMDFWPGEIIDLPRPPLISITAVETLDEDDTATTYSSCNYYTLTEVSPGKLVLKQAVTWPSNTERDYGGYQIRYAAGYGTNRSDVPIQIRQGLKLWVMDLYENRVMRDIPPPEADSFMKTMRVLPV